MTDAEFAQCISDLVQHEGSIGWMYRDNAVAGNVTVGIGCLIPDVQAAQALPFVFTDTSGAPTKPASPALIAWDMTRVMRCAPGLIASAYRAHQTLVFLQTADIDNLAKTRLSKEFLPGLVSIFPNFDTLPIGPKRALVDMAWNLGIHGLKGFPTMIHAVQAQDWATAAVQCHRSTCRADRNAWTAAMFLTT